MRRLAIALLLPLPFAALPLLALAFPGGGPGSEGAPTVVTVTSDTTIRYGDEPLAHRTGRAGLEIHDCDVYADQS